MVVSDVRKQLKGYRLTTVEIIYYMPDYPDILQKFVWQLLDVPPDFPRLMKFLRFWEHEIDGQLHSVHVADVGIITPTKWRNVEGEYTLH